MKDRRKAGASELDGKVVTKKTEKKKKGRRLEKVCPFQRGGVLPVEGLRPEINLTMGGREGIADGLEGGNFFKTRGTGRLVGALV